MFNKYLIIILSLIYKLDNITKWLYTNKVMLLIIITVFYIILK